MQKQQLPLVFILILSLIIFPSITANAQYTDPQNSSCTCISISAVGDCTLGIDESQAKYANFNLEYKKQNNDAYFLKKVASILANDDLSLANFEGTLTTRTQRTDKQYAFKGSPSYVNILKAGSIDAVNLANNHSHDYGFQSFTDTQTTLDNSLINTYGIGRPTFKLLNGIKIGLIGINTLALSDTEAKIQVVRQINICRIKSADLIIISFHWGDEGSYKINTEQQTLAHLAIDEGADLVLGHHPHVMQSIESYKDKFIIYSLGNFCFGGNTNPSDKDTFIYQQTFTFENGILQINKNARIIPCSLSSVSERNNFQPKILKGNEQLRVLNKLNELSKGYGVSFGLNGFVRENNNANSVAAKNAIPPKIIGNVG